jgi:hypothetical protein
MNNNFSRIVTTILLGRCAAPLPSEAGEIAPAAAELHADQFLAAIERGHAESQ